MDHVHGVNFLFDYYAIFGVPRDTDLETIKRSYRELQQKWHPDKYEHLAKELKARAEQVSGILAEGYAVLSDKERRAAYDKQLAEWKGPVATDPTPIISDYGSDFSPARLLFGEKRDRGPLEKVFTSLSGYDETTFKVIEQLFKSTPDPSDELAKAYETALQKKALHLSLKEHSTWRDAGFASPEIRGVVGSGQSEKTEEVIAKKRAIIEEKVQQSVAMLKGGAMRLLGPAGEKLAEEMKEDETGALARVQAQAMANFDAIAEEIRKVAREQSEIARELLQLVKPVYRPEQQHKFPRIVIYFQGTQEKPMAFVLNQTQGAHIISIDCSLPPEALENLEAPERAQALVDQGWNVACFDCKANLDIPEQLQAFLEKHFEPFLKNASS